MRSGCADPIFVRGIMPRSGTNLLWDLLRLHPDCAIAREPIWEDNVLAQADLLGSYVRRTAATWQDVDGPTRVEFERALSGRIGDGVVGFLSTTADKHLLTKTPHIHHLDQFFTFFPRARLLILVRDGRSVVASALATFGGRFETYARLWAEAADAIRRFDRAHPDDGNRYRIVRYEDLIADVPGYMRSLLSFLDLDAGRYDFDAATRLPVRGSSVAGTSGPGRVHWAPVERPAGFDPTDRFGAWTSRRHERFNWIAGRQLSEFGYEPVRRRRAVVRNLALDVAWTCARPLRPVRRRLIGAGTRLRRRASYQRSSRS